MKKNFRDGVSSTERYDEGNGVVPKKGREPEYNVSEPECDVKYYYINDWLDL